MEIFFQVDKIIKFTINNTVFFTSGGGVWLLKCCKIDYTISKNYIYLYSIKNIFFFCENFVIQRKYIYIQSKYTCV